MSKQLQAAFKSWWLKLSHSNCRLHNVFRWSILCLTMKICVIFFLSIRWQRICKTHLSTTREEHVPPCKAVAVFVQQMVTYQWDLHMFLSLKQKRFHLFIIASDKSEYCGDCLTFPQMSYKLLEVCLNCPDGPKILQKRRKPNGMWLIWSQGCDFQPLVIKRRSKSVAKKKKKEKKSAAWG